MTIPLDAITSPPISQETGDVYIEIYCNKNFTASSGRGVIRGDLNSGNWCLRGLCTNVANVIGIPLLNIEPTEDGIDDQTAKYSAYLRPVNQQPAPYLLDFTVPPLNAGQSSTSWPRLRLHKVAISTLPDNETYNKAQTEQLVDLIAGQFNLANQIHPGIVTTTTADSQVVSADDVRVTAGQAVNVPSIRPLGTGATDAAAGNDTRITGAAQKSANLSDLANPSTARSSLGLGNSATKNVGTISGTVAAGDDSRFAASAVVSFNGRVGPVVAATNDYTWAQVNKATSSLQDVATKTKLTSGTLYDSYGDSITIADQVGVTNGGYRTLLATRNGWTNTNHAVDGDQAADQSLVVVQKTITDSDDQRFTLMIGYNDMRLYLSSAAKQGFFRRYAAATMAWLTIPNNRKLFGTDTTNMPETGSGWANDAVIGRRSGTAADTKSFTVVGRTIYIASLLHDNAGAGTATITIDGVSYGTMTSKAIGATSLNGVTFAPALYRFSGLDDTAHSVVVTIDGTGFFYVEWVAGNSGLPLLHGPQLWVGTITRGTAAGYAASGGSDALVGTYNRELSNAVSELNADGLAITLVNTNFLNTATDYDASGIHPTDAGHVKLANGFEFATNELADPTTRRRVNTATVLNAAPATPLGLSDLNSLTQAALYVKSSKLVVVYNNAGTLTFITIPLDGATTTWTQTTTPP